MCNVSLNIWVCSSLSVCAFDSWEYTVYCGVLCLLYVIILSKFQPNMVLLSGLIFTCPVPSPTFTLRVKLAVLKKKVLREFTQTTKVCERKTKNKTEKIELPERFIFVNAWFHDGWVACMIWSSSFIERCHPEWMIWLSVSQQMHFIVTFSNPSYE